MKLITKESRQISLRFARSYEELRYRGLVSTKKEFSISVGIGSPSNLNRIESNENYEPSLSNLCILISKYNVSVDWLFFGKGNFLVNENK